MVADATEPEELKRAGDGVYAYATQSGTRYRFAFRQADGRLSNRRGFISRTAARRAKRELEEEVRRGELSAARGTFEEFWVEFLASRRPYLTPGAFVDYETHGRKRLLPFFAGHRLAGIDESVVRTWITGFVPSIEAGKLAAKTVNNARTCLSVALNEAVARGLLVRNPCARVKPLPTPDVERDFLRMHEIDGYLEACPAYYRLLAELLVATGARISEALALKWDDVDFEASAIRIYRQRDRAGTGTAATKGKRFRAVQVGPRMLAALKGHRSDGNHQAADWLFVCPSSTRGRYADRNSSEPPHRKTVHQWHEDTLADANLRDMPLHALRHTAAAAWLASGQPLMFVQRQLGHRSITTTESHYGHLEAFFVKDAAARTEANIANARQLIPG